MRYGCVIPLTTEPDFVHLAAAAEAAGWDAVFSWEAVWRHDAWATLAAAAMVTERIRLATLLTPASRYRPWDLAARVATVDRLSGGRVTLGVGLGALNDNWLAFEPAESRAVRAAKLDETLAVYTGLLRGQPFEYHGRHWQVRATAELNPPPPVQRPHPPVWCVGALLPGRDEQPSLRRAARWQGIFPAVAAGQQGHSALTPQSLREIVTRITRLREQSGATMTDYDVVVEGDSWGGFGQVRPPLGQWAEAGATWWVESWWDLPETDAGLAELRERIAAGPRRDLGG